MRDHVSVFRPTDADVESQEVSVTESVDDGGQAAVAGGTAAAFHAQASGRQIEVVTHDHGRLGLHTGPFEEGGQNFAGAIHVCEGLCEHQRHIRIRRRSRVRKTVASEQGLSQRNTKPRGGFFNYRETDVMPRALKPGPGVTQAHNQYGQPLLLGFLGLFGFLAFFETLFAFDLFLFDFLFDLFPRHSNQRDGLVLTVEDLDTFEIG